MENSKEDLINFLSNVPLFSSVTNEQLEEIASFFTPEFYAKNVEICTQGEEGDSMFVIYYGLVSIFKNINGEEVFAAELQRGDFFGELALLSDEPRNATARVSIDAKVYRLKRHDFEKLIRLNKSIGLYLSRYYARRINSTKDADAKKKPVFFSLSSTAKNLGNSYFLYTCAYHISTESSKKTLIIEPYLNCEDLLKNFGLQRTGCPVPELFMFLPDKSYKFEDINWFVHESGFYVLNLSTGFTDKLYKAVPLILEQIKKSFDVVFFNVSSDLGKMEKLLIRLCDQTYVIISNTEATLGNVAKHIENIENIFGSNAFFGKVKIGVSHLEGTIGIPREKLKESLKLAETPRIWVEKNENALLDKIDTAKHFPVKGPRAVAREIAGVRLGLALGAGAARGFAHIGVLKVLADYGIHIDMISGASMGALVGGFYAANPSVDVLRKNTIDIITSKKDARKKLFDYTIPVKGFLKGGKVSKIIEKAVNKADFLDLKIPAYICGVDIESGEEFIFETGDVTQAIRSSISIPAVFSPHKYKNRWMVDGALLNPVPVDTLLRKGADIVIAVCIETVAGKGLHKNSIDIKGVVTRTISIVHGKATNDFSRKADIVLYPDVSSFGWDDFHKGKKMMIAGMEETIEKLPEILKIINEKSKAG
ncbi:MAG: patatin-like phospholipase family protein [Thermodesulfobacteriota bacterium]